MNVVELPVENFRDVGRVLAKTREADLTDILVIGYDEQGELWTGTNVADGPEMLWLLELARAKLLHRSVQGVVAEIT